MISHRDRLIFVHLRRTAGNSIEVALGGIELLDEAGMPTTTWHNDLHRGPSAHKLDRRGHAIHATAEEIRRLHPREFDAYFRFSIVRNPWSQMLSLYQRLFAADVALSGFRRWLRRFHGHRGTVPRASLCDRRGELLVDFVGRYESLEQDFATACDRAGVPRRPLPRTNPSAGVDLAAAYDDASQRLVARIFAADIDRYGYSFPLSRLAA